MQKYVLADLETVQPKIWFKFSAC